MFFFESSLCEENGLAKKDSITALCATKRMAEGNLLTIVFKYESRTNNIC